MESGTGGKQWRSNVVINLTNRIRGKGYRRGICLETIARHANKNKYRVEIHVGQMHNWKLKKKQRAQEKAGEKCGER